MSHYFDKNPTSEFIPTSFGFKVKNRVFNAQAGSGVFSKNELDRATKVLLEHCRVSDGDVVLDLACGWGPVGMVLKTVLPSIELTMSDVNPRAVKLARQNMNGKDARIIVSDRFEKIDGDFDVIFLNPPMAAGRALCYELIELSKEHLKKGASLQLVARHQKGGKALESHMQEVFGNVETLAKKGGFRVYMSIRE